MSFPQLGGCECAEIRYRLVSDPVTLYACHCTDCQTATGSSFALSMYVARDAVELIQGEPRLREFSLPDGRQRRGFACPRCGATLWSDGRRLPNLLNLQPGTLDDTSWLQPVGHIWTRSAQPWVAIPPDTLQYEKQPDDPLPLVQAWKSRNPGSRGSDPFPDRIRSLPRFDGPFDAFRLAAEGCEVLFASYPAGSTIEPHSHDTENCGLITEGELILISDGSERRFGPGQWYHLAPGQVHAARFEVATSEVEFWFER